MKKFQLKQTNEELQADLDRIEQLFDLVYPVGSIYMSTNNVSPATLFSGTWDAIEGKFLLGADNTYNVGDTGGSASTTLAVENLPAHTHTISTAGTIEESGNLSMSGSTIANNSGEVNLEHTHTINHTHGNTFSIDNTSLDHKHSMSHSHTTSDHAHLISGSTSNSGDSGKHFHYLSGTSKVQTDIGSGTTFSCAFMAESNSNGTTKYLSDMWESSTSMYTATDGAHTHTMYFNSQPNGSETLSLNANTGNALNVSGSAWDLKHNHTLSGGVSTYSGNSGSALGEHAHTIPSLVVNVSGANHTHNISITASASSTGSGTAFSNMPPYLAVYMWKRVA